MNIAFNVFYIHPIMLALCLMLLLTHYAQNYAGMIGGSLLITSTVISLVLLWGWQKVSPGAYWAQTGNCAWMMHISVIDDEMDFA